MAHKQILPVSLILILSCLRIAYSQDDSTEEKSGAPIIRQINKVNDDGTYTYGYEAADGSFKIETRDVLGNVKGMFGFIDDSGDLKRVSYTANNATGYRNSVIHPPVSTTARSSELGRRPVLILKNTAASSSPTKGPVIQHIPKKSMKEEDETTSTEFSSARPYPSTRNDSSEERTEEPTRSPPPPPLLNPLRKVLVSKRPVEDKENRGKGGNNLRRQLSRGLDLRGEMSHIYAGGDNRFASGIPPHLSALMSELRPVQVIRATAPETVGYQIVDPESASQEINEVPTTTTEIPYGSRRPLNPAGYISSRLRRPVPVAEEAQYLQEINSPYRHHNLPVLPRGYQGTQGIQPIAPVSSHLPIPMHGAEYQTHPQYYDQGAMMIPPTLRDELMTIIYNYLHMRLNPLAQNPYYGRYPSYSSPYLNPHLFTPATGYPYSPAGYPQSPYGHPYLPLNGYYPPYANPQAVYPAPAQTPYSGPNVQFARPEHQRRLAPATRSQSARAADDADLLQMLLTSPTRVPLISQLKYTPTTERLVNAKTGQPIRNVQIITETTETRPVTTEAAERK